jgi:HK97 family phage portal protein
VSLITRLRRGASSVSDQRALSGLGQPGDWLKDALTGGQTFSGKTVTIEGSLALVPVYSAVSLLAGATGSLPLIVYRRLGEDGRERAHTHRTWPLLHDQPNPEMAADEVWELVMAHLLLWGNAFIAKIRDNFGVVTELWPLRPNRVQVGRDNQGNRYFVVDGNGRYDNRDILHIRGLGTDGLVGLSPVQQARQMLAGAMALEEFTGDFWANDAQPGVVLSHPNKLSPDAAKNLKASWDAAHKVKGKTAVLEEGITVERLTMPLEDAQFIETQKFNDLRVAQLFRIPPFYLGAASGDSLTYSNAETQGIDFVRWSLRRWLIRIEGALLRDPSLFLQGQRFYPEFLVDSLLRADTAVRYGAYKTALDGQFLTVDEVRELENRAPIKPADQPQQPANTNGGQA